MISSERLINAIDALYEAIVFINGNGIIHTYDREYNPIVEIITPEWFNSDCHRILRTRSPEWKQLDGSRLMRKMADDLNKKDCSLIGRDFEKSFCCWYQAYHYFPREKWGIHLRYDGILAVASDLSRSKRKPSDLLTDYVCVKSAFLYLYSHCFFHYLLENIVSHLELASENPSLYGRYISDIYTNVFNTTACIEEALANRYTLHSAVEYQIDKEYLKHKLLRQGDGYRNFINYCGKNFQLGKKQLLSQIKGYRSDSNLDQSWERLLDNCISRISEFKKYRIPIWLHYAPLPVSY